MRITLIGLLLSALAAAEPPLDPRWEVPAAQGRDNGLRGELCLNAFWRADGGKEPWVRVPSLGDRKQQVSLWREVEVPAAWAGRTIELDLGDSLDAAPSYFNGRSDPRLPAPVVTVDGVAIPGGRGPIPAAAAGSRLRIAWQGGIIAGDSWLRSRPASAARIDDTYLWAGVAEGRLHLRAAGQGAAATLALTVSASPDLSAPLGSWRLAPSADGPGWSLAAALPLAGLPLWSPWEPRLVWYGAELLAADGRVLDRILPRRTGLREVTVADGRVRVNGIPLWAAGDVCESLTTGNVHVGQARGYLRNLKALGLGYAFANGCEAWAAIADEEGFALRTSLGSLAKFNIWDPRSGLLDMGGGESAESILRRVRQLREHPSILFWGTPTPFNIQTLNAAMVGIDQHPWNGFPLNRDPEQSRRAHLKYRELNALVAAQDPARPLAAHVSPWSPIEEVTRYVTDNLDLQEQAEFFEHWFRNQPDKALWPSEFGTPFQGHQYLRRTSFQHPHTKPYPALVYENAARLFGDAVYAAEPDAVLAGWHRMGVEQHREGAVFQRAMAEQMTAILRAWRAWGVNARGHHVLVDGFALAGKGRDCSFGQAEGDPRQPGLSVPARDLRFPILGTDRTLLAGEALLAAYRPVIGFIAGGRGEFTDGSHAFTAGGAVEKALVVLNDTGAPVEVAGAWTLADAAGAVVARGELAGPVPAGDRTFDRFPIRFACPAVAARSDLRLSVAARAGAAAIADQVVITVFPARQGPAWPAGRAVWRLNLSDDRIHERRHFAWNRVNEEMLAATGLETRLVAGLRTFAWEGVGPPAVRALDTTRALVAEGTPAPGDLLIIPRHCLRSAPDSQDLNLRLLDRLGLDRLVEQGLNLLVLEQDLPNVFGLRTQETRPRRAFRAAPGHPVFDGIEDADLASWNGHSDLAPAHTPWSESADELPDQFWRCSNRNSVATRVFVRPQVGAVRALAVCGFDLMESPLLEVCRGRGRMLFCSFDVSSRYGGDPVATRLLDNCLRYLLTAPAPDPALQGVEVLAAGDARLREAVRPFRLERPEGADGWGITRGELFLRDAIYRGHLPTKEPPDLRLPEFADAAPGVHQAVRRDGGRFLLAFGPERLPSEWARRKLAWIRAALQVNAGGSDAGGPALALHGQSHALYPVDWCGEFVHPYSVELW
jgi:hypothetical protein